MKKIVTCLLLGLSAVYFSANYVPNWRMQNDYSELLTPSSRAVLAAQENLTIEVFAQPNSPAAALVNNFLQPLIGDLAAVRVEYVDFFNNPALIDTYGISKQGEMVIHSGAQKFHLSSLSYEAFFNGLKKLDQAIDKWIVLLDNLDGKSFEVGIPGGLNKWVKALQNSNYPSVILPYSDGLELPNQVKLIVLASPVMRFSEEQIQWLQSQISSGISVLWLVDPSTVMHQPGLSLLFDVMRTDGYHQDHLIIRDFNDHPINHQFDRPLDLVEIMPFQTNNDVLWSNAEKQVVASTQVINQSRIMVIGDSDFLSNAFLKSGGNLEMSFRLVDWLLHNDNRIDLPTLGSKGTQLHYNKNEILFFSGSMLILLPGILLIIGVVRWRQGK